MAWYSIYKYNFIKNQQGNLFAVADDSDSVFDNAQQYFGQLFHQGTSLIAFKTRKGEHVECPNAILSHHDNIIVMRLCDNRTVNVWQDYKRSPEVTNPFCHIVIDNRPGRCLIAIEKDSSFGKTDKAADILEGTLNNYLSDYRLSIEINQQIRTDEFWNYVEEQTRVNNDPIRKVVFDFPNPKLTYPLISTKKVVGKVNSMLSMLGASNAVKGHFHMDASKEGTLKLLRTNKDLAQMVELCHNNGYSLSVFFKHYGLFRVNDQIKAVKKMEEAILADFIGLVRLTSGSYGLIVWLDELDKHMQKYNNATKIPAPRKRGNKGNV